MPVPNYPESSESAAPLGTISSIVESIGTFGSSEVVTYPGIRSGNTGTAISVPGAPGTRTMLIHNAGTAATVGILGNDYTAAPGEPEHITSMRGHMEIGRGTME